ncbi:hypothetical protein HY218_00410 [Candidatus Saccharibacteria bacterium]|nr:hypothetical protein [Candidatus Saccharibacteria bacterium]
MTIKAMIRGTGSQLVKDYLGGDKVERGQLREAVYPTVEVVYFIAETHEELGSATYILRPGSAIETMKDVNYRIKEEIAKFKVDPNRLKAKPPEFTPPVASADVQAQVDDLSGLIGKEM